MGNNLDGDVETYVCFKHLLNYLKKSSDETDKKILDWVKESVLCMRKVFYKDRLWNKEDLQVACETVEEIYGVAKMQRMVKALHQRHVEMFLFFNKGEELELQKKEMQADWNYFGQPKENEEWILTEDEIRYASWNSGDNLYLDEKINYTEPEDESYYRYVERYYNNTKTDVEIDTEVMQEDWNYFCPPEDDILEEDYYNEEDELEFQKKEMQEDWHYFGEPLPNIPIPPISNRWTKEQLLELLDYANEMNELGTDKHTIYQVAEKFNKPFRTIRTKLNHIANKYPNCGLVIRNGKFCRYGDFKPRYVEAWAKYQEDRKSGKIESMINEYLNHKKK